MWIGLFRLVDDAKLHSLMDKVTQPQEMLKMKCTHYTHREKVNRINAVTSRCKKGVII